MSRLDELKRRAAELTAYRAERIGQLRFEIQDLNRRYDQEITRIGREIAKLEPVLGVTSEPAPAPKAPKPRQERPKRDVFTEINRYNREHGLPEVTHGE